jgi:hypothetical protein
MHGGREAWAVRKVPIEAELARSMADGQQARDCREAKTARFVVL